MKPPRKRDGIEVFHGSIRDIMTGYRAFSYRFVKTFPILSCRFEIETEMSIHAIDKRMQVENVIIPYRDRPEGSVSKLNTFSDGWSVIKTLIRLFRIYNPFAFWYNQCSVASCCACIIYTSACHLF